MKWESSWNKDDRKECERDLKEGGAEHWEDEIVRLNTLGEEKHARIKAGGGDHSSFYDV